MAKVKKDIDGGESSNTFSTGVVRLPGLDRFHIRLDWIIRTFFLLLLK